MIWHRSFDICALQILMALAWELIAVRAQEVQLFEGTRTTVGNLDLSWKGTSYPHFKYSGTSSVLHGKIEAMNWMVPKRSQDRWKALAIASWDNHSTKWHELKLEDAHHNGDKNHGVFVTLRITWTQVKDMPPSAPSSPEPYHIAH